MSSPCGVPGCKYSKFTPDGNKSFKCSFWKNASSRKNEAISLELSKNNDPEIIKVRAQRINFQSIKPEPIGNDFGTAFAQQLKLLNRFNFDVENFDVPDLLDLNSEFISDDFIDEEPLEKENFKPSLNSFDNSHDNVSFVATIQGIVSGKSETTDFNRVDSTSQITNDLTSQHQLNQEKLDDSVHLQLQEKQVNDRSHVENSTINLNSLKELQITYNKLIKYSKNLVLYKDSNYKKQQLFFVSNNPARIKYFVKMYPALFSVQPGIDYSVVSKNHRPMDYIESNSIIVVPYYEKINPNQRFKENIFSFFGETNSDKLNLIKDGPNFDLNLFQHVYKFFNLRQNIVFEDYDRTVINMKQSRCLKGYLQDFKISEEEFNLRFFIK